ncbi:MAG: hypothetical protein ABW328_17635 [Ilumatobacteraceae bacterium]
MTSPARTVAFIRVFAVVGVSTADTAARQHAIALRHSDGLAGRT